MGERSRKGWREERLTSEAAAGAFGSVYLFVSYVASLTAGVQASGFTSRAPHSSRVCERGRRRRTTSSPLISLYCLLPSFRQLYRHAPFPGVIFTGERCG